MPFVKLDCGILNSTLWFERDEREVFITALLMAEPCELVEPTSQLQVNSLNDTGWVVPPGWYGFVPAAGVGIIHRARVDETLGLRALERLGSPESLSRSREYEGRRLVRIDGGYLVLNYMKYRDRDYTTAERSKRYRERKQALASRRGVSASRRDVSASRRDITQAEAEADQDHKITPAASKPTRRARPEPAPKVLARLAHEVLDAAPPDTAESELGARLKDAAADLRLVYDGAAIGTALDVARAQKGKRPKKSPPPYLPR